MKGEEGDMWLAPVRVNSFHLLEEPRLSYSGYHLTHSTSSYLIHLADSTQALNALLL